MNMAFARLRRLLASATGISLDADKLYLAESRLVPIMRANGVVDLAELVRQIEKREDEKLLQAVIDAMTTNETFFFRDRTPFEQFRRDILPELMAKRQDKRRISIWCAACSTGQEPYSLAMLLDEESSKLKEWTVDILATDLSETALDAARRGIYSQFEVQRGLSTSRLLRHFEQHGDNWQVSERLRSRILFRHLNLLSNIGKIGPFDIIFCRNVLLYFDLAIKRDVLSRLSKVIAGDGYLILGAAETAGDANQHFIAASSDFSWRLQRRQPSLQLVAAGA